MIIDGEDGVSSSPIATNPVGKERVMHSSSPLGSFSPYAVDPVDRPRLVQHGNGSSRNFEQIVA